MYTYSELEAALRRDYPAMKFCGIDAHPPDNVVIHGMEQPPQLVFRGLYEVEGRGYPYCWISLHPDMPEDYLLCSLDSLIEEAEYTLRTLVLS